MAVLGLYITGKIKPFALGEMERACQFVYREGDRLAAIAFPQVGSMTRASRFGGGLARLRKVRSESPTVNPMDLLTTFPIRGAGSLQIGRSIRRQ